MNPSLPTLARPWRAYVAGLALALAGGASLTAFAAPGAGPGMHVRHGGGGDFMLGSPRHMNKLLDSVDATEEQRAQLKAIAQAAAADLRARRDASRSLRQQQMDLFTQPTVDANAVEALRQKMLVEHDARTKRVAQAMVEASRVLTPEQRAQLGTRMKERKDLMERHQRERRSLDKPATS